MSPNSPSGSPVGNQSAPARQFRQSRRALLRGTAATGAIVVASSILNPASAPAKRPQVVAADLEVVTATTTSITLYWVTYALSRPGADGIPVFADADTEVFLGPAETRGSLPLVYSDQAPRRSHMVTISGLEPGREYRFEARSGGCVATATMIATRSANSPEMTGRVRTLTPPPGQFVATIAVLNDTHVGEDKHGILVGNFPRPIEQESGLSPFAELMLAGALDDIRAHRVDDISAHRVDDISAHRVDHLVINGDLTSEARPTEVRRAKQILDGYGRLGVDYSVTRGNHDRPHTVSSDPNAGYDSATPIPGTAHFDPFGDAFVPFQKAWTSDVGALRILGVDSTHLDEAGGVIAPEQFTDIERLLAEDRSRPTLMLAHHPVTSEAARTNLGGPGFILDRADRNRLQQLHVDNPGVFLMLAGHTHRCKVTHGDTSAAVHYLETGSAAGYPGGYTLIHLYTGGYQVNFHRTSSEDALRWTRRARFAALTFLPEYTLGSFADRNHIVQRDLSALL